MAQPLSDVEWIFVVLATLYLVEAIPWVRPGCTPFASMLGRFRGLVPAPRLIGNDFGGLHACGLAPFDATFIAESVPVAVAPEGVFVAAPSGPLEAERVLVREKLLRWNDIDQLRRCDRDLRFGDHLLCRLRSSVAADELLGALRELAATSDADRPAAIRRWIASTFDLGGTRQSLERWRASTRGLRVAATLLFVWIFPIGLARYYGLLPGPRHLLALILYLSVFFLFWWWANLQFFLSHRRLHPDATAARWKMLFATFVSPAVPLRAADHLARQHFTFIHPLTLAAALAPREKLRQITAITLRDLRYPRLPEVSTEAPEAALLTLHAYRRLQLEAAMHLAGEIGFDAESLLVPSSPQDPASQSYCPRCLQEFVWQEAACVACGNRATVPFAAS